MTYFHIRLTSCLPTTNTDFDVVVKIINIVKGGGV